MNIYFIIEVKFLSLRLITHIIHPTQPVIKSLWNTCIIFFSFIFFVLISTPNYTPLKHRRLIKVSNQIGLFTFLVTLLNPLDVQEVSYGPEDVIWCCLRLFVLMLN